MKDCCLDPFIMMDLLPSAAEFEYYTHTWVYWSVSKQPFPDSLLLYIWQ